MNTALLAVVVLQALLLVALVVLFLRHMRAQEEAWTDDRRELLNRIAQPTAIALKRPAAPTPPPPRRDAGNQVGIVHGLRGEAGGEE